jgi:hypothetical protein
LCVWGCRQKMDEEEGPGFYPCLQARSLSSCPPCSATALPGGPSCFLDTIPTAPNLWLPIQSNPKPVNSTFRHTYPSASRHHSSSQLLSKTSHCLHS